MTLDIPKAGAEVSSGPGSAALPTPTAPSIETLDVFLSLDVALELIHADRESLKRVDTFSGYPGHYGHRVRDTIEEVFILMLQVMAERHLKPGFELYAPIQLVLLYRF
jgi:recyclin-1